MQIELAIRKILKKDVTVYTYYNLTSGVINNTYKVLTDIDTFFIKVKDASVNSDMYECEIKGLEKINKINPIIAVNQIGTCTINDYSYILLEWIENAPQHKDFYEILGRYIAQIHFKSQSKFGLSYDNYIGALVQTNNTESKWSNFFVNERIEPNLKKAIKSNNLDPSFITILPKLKQLITDEFPDEKPALLHGDLWSGNILTNYNGLPILVDPAVYYGNREMDIAMTMFTGALPEAFYASYNEVFKLENNWKDRIGVHLLYYYLVHINIFGNAYTQQTTELINKYIK